MREDSNINCEDYHIQGLGTIKELAEKLDMKPQTLIRYAITHFYTEPEAKRELIIATCVMNIADKCFGKEECEKIMIDYKQALRDMQEGDLEKLKNKPKEFNEIVREYERLGIDSLHDIVCLAGEYLLDWGEDELHPQIALFKLRKFVYGGHINKFDKNN